MGSQAKSAKPRLKICGIRSAEDARLCRQLGVDYVGFNFYTGSKRHIEPAAARAAWIAATKAEAAATTAAVGILVHARADDVHAAMSAFPELRILQFHGPVPVPLRLTWAGPWWQAVAVGAAADIVAASGAVPSSGGPALVLFDSAVRPAGQPVPGGSGQRFDWQWLANYTGPLPFGVAGGIAPGMLSSLTPYRPQLVDVCSGVEDSPGHKDPVKVQALVHEFKAWREAGLAL